MTECKGVQRDMVCVDTYRVLDSCRDKDCFEDVRVFLTVPGAEMLNRAGAVRAKTAKVVWACVDMDSVPFNRGQSLLPGIRFSDEVIARAGDFADLFGQQEVDALLHRGEEALGNSLCQLQLGGRQHRFGFHQFLHLFQPGHVRNHTGLPDDPLVDAVIEWDQHPLPGLQLTGKESGDRVIKQPGFRRGADDDTYGFGISPVHSFRLSPARQA